MQSSGMFRWVSNWHAHELRFILGKLIFVARLCRKSQNVRRSPVSRSDCTVPELCMRRFLQALVVAVALPSSLVGHGGGLDSFGCHHNRKLAGNRPEGGQFGLWEGMSVIL